MTPTEIVALREHLGLSQAQFAARLNEVDPNLAIDQKSVSRWERGHVAPGPHVTAALSRIAYRSPQQRDGYDMDRHRLATVVRQYGVTRVASERDLSMLVLRSSWHWEVVRDTPGVVLFRRYPAGWTEWDTGAPNPELDGLLLERHTLAQLMETTAAASYHDRDVRRSRDEAEQRIKEIDARRLEIDAWYIGSRSVDLRRQLDSYDRRRNPEGWSIEEWAAQRERVAVELADLESRAAALSPDPLSVLAPIEGVLCVNADPSDHWRDEAEKLSYPTVVLFRDEAGFATTEPAAIVDGEEVAH